ncbi:hypothetical protein [Nonomuraea typhae]|uniref:hypothetical protein n=1 Tax=Nonomuraea typhae TaxID=2603600 RepID=UPI0012FB32C4|nr:hypothetical protein [Nonomuraea typhae]
MKKTITAVAAAGVVLAGALPAQAAPKDPVGVLKSLVKPGAGVRFTETATVTDDGSQVDLVSRKGAFALGRKSVAASDLTTKPISPTLRLKDDRKPERVISIGKDIYVGGGLWAGELPKGKSWVKTRATFLKGGVYGRYGQPINPAEPATLAALLKRAEQAGGAYTGTVTLRELAKISPWFSGTSQIGRDETQLTYRITVTSAGVVSKVSSTMPADRVTGQPGFDDETVTVVSAFTGWGKKVSIKAPDPSTVTTK